MVFNEFFKRATGFGPFPYQRRFADSESLPQLVCVPTGLGKTAMAVIGWLWRRLGAEGRFRDQTPRRLAYCLPTRVLVEQTRDNAIRWLSNLGLLPGTARFEDADGRTSLVSYTPDSNEPGKVSVHTLMGGEGREDWDMYPEREAILVGTQDMLLSRALNRGYAAGRSRWPMQFGQLNTDCMWVFDEIQLMGAGLATTAQLEAFREQLGEGNSCPSVWMSATLQPAWLETVDFAEQAGALTTASLELSHDDASHREVDRRLRAEKPLEKARASMGESAGLAALVREAHKPGTLTIAVMNTVGRAGELYKALKALDPGGGRGAGSSPRRTAGQGDLSAKSPEPRTVLLHSRFRPEDRMRRLEETISDCGEVGAIVVSTQVIEAGVDMSATTLFTEAAPWSSLVQRFGRCNRTGDDEKAQVFWIDLPADEETAEKAAAPYDLDMLRESCRMLKGRTNVGPGYLPQVELPFHHTDVIRRKDIIDLFDTSPDLAGNDIDIDRFVREADKSDVRVFWRDYHDSPNAGEGREVEPAPLPRELCPAPVEEFRKFVGDGKRAGKVWRWSFLDRRWEKLSREHVVAGQVYLIHADAGGYSEECGWDSSGSRRVEPLIQQNGAMTEASEATEDDRLSHADSWQSVAEHSSEVCDELELMARALSLAEEEEASLRYAAVWHDRGKAHSAFLAKLKEEALGAREARERMSEGNFIAKAPAEAWIRGRNGNAGYRKYFRHELASALALLLAPETLVPEGDRDLAAYLIAAHHGKVRLSIRSLPDENRPADNRRFARGVWEGDKLPATRLGDGITAPAVSLSLEPMELGRCREEPFRGRPSWSERAIHLRNALGPFRLAYLESILRAADWKASRKARSS